MEMTPKERSAIVEWVISATEDLHGISDPATLTEIENEVLAMTDEELLREEAWLEELYHK